MSRKAGINYKFESGVSAAVGRRTPVDLLRQCGKPTTTQKIRRAAADLR